MEFAMARAASNLLSGCVTRARGKRRQGAIAEDADELTINDPPMQARPPPLNHRLAQMVATLELVTRLLLA